MVDSAGIPVLVVEDEPALQSLLGRFLTAKGFSPKVCGTCAEAVAAFQSQRFAAAVVDVSLPDGSGLDLAAVLFRIRPDVRLVVCSGLPVSVEEVPVDSTADVVVLQKPFLPVRLVEALSPVRPE